MEKNVGGVFECMYRRECKIITFIEFLDISTKKKIKKRGGSETLSITYF